VPASSIEAQGITDRRFEGTIVSIDPVRGFGFIECAELRSSFGNKDIFLHKAQVGGFKAGDRVSFGVLLYQDGKPQAKDLRDASLGTGSALVPASALHSEDVLREVEVPVDLAGALVGKQGSVIMDLQRRAGGGVHIQVLQPRVEGGPQVAQITGPQANADIACDLVHQKLEEIRDARQHFDVLRGVAPPLETIPKAGHELLVSAAASSSTPAASLSDSSSSDPPALALERLMLEKAQDPASGMTCGTPEGGEVTHEISLPPDLVGAFVGKQGSSITELQMRSGGIHVQVQQPIVQGGVQVATISGPVTNANLGLLLARQKLDELREARATYDELRTSGPLGLPAQPPAALPAPETTVSFADGEATHDIEVSADLVGALVGKQGSSIMELQRRAGTGVHIQIQQPAYRGGPQLATITGPAAGAAYGAQLVRDRIHEIQQQRAIFDADRASRGGQQQAGQPGFGGQAAGCPRGLPALRPPAGGRPPGPGGSSQQPQVDTQALVAVLQALLPAVGGATRPPHR